ncbi:MAG: RNA-guided endonuclease IscB [Candidatus Hermodarchaeota archaeon]
MLDKQKKPLMPCSEKRAKLLLQRKRAVVHQMAPFTIRLKDRWGEESEHQLLRIKIDPGAKITGIVLIREQAKEEQSQVSSVIWAAEIHHKTNIKTKLTKRRVLRRGRRSRKIRYRKVRFQNRPKKRCHVCGGNTPKKSKGGRTNYCRKHQNQRGEQTDKRYAWLPPSLKTRVEQTIQTIRKLNTLAPLTAISIENVKFDTQLLQNPEIQEIEYQQGTLWGYEVKEYLLEKFDRECAYCQGMSGDLILEVDHVVPQQPKRGQAGSNRISNLVIACRTCNELKGNTQPKIWGRQLAASANPLDQIRVARLAKITQQLRKPLKAAAFLNATRWRLYAHLQRFGLPVECGTGAQTKMNRLALGLPKTHVFDATCVGSSTSFHLKFRTAYFQIWQAIGRGTRQMARVNKAGFPLTHRMSGKQVYGFQTGDLVVAEIPQGKFQGRWRGRVVVRASGYFDLKDLHGHRLCQGISYKYCRVLQRAAGWYYTQQLLPPLTGETVHFSPN